MSDHMEAKTIDDLRQQIERLQAALRLADAEIGFALCFTDLERVQRAMAWAQAEISKALRP
jgi:hypothetical protein